MCSSCLRISANQLASILTQILNPSLDWCGSGVPSSFNSSIIIPTPKKLSITGINDYRPFAPTLIVIKIALRNWCWATWRTPQAPCSLLTEKRVCGWSSQRHTAAHLASLPRDIYEDLFLDVCLALNTIIPTWIHLWEDHRLPDWQQAADKAGEQHIQHLHHQHWCPQERLLPPLLFSLYTNDGTYHRAINLYLTCTLCLLFILYFFLFCVESHSLFVYTNLQINLILTLILILSKTCSNIL